MKKKYLLFGALALALLVTAGFAYQNFREKQAQEQWLAHMTETVERSTFYEGIFLDDVPLGGLSLQEASDQFQKIAEQRLSDLRVELTYEDQSWVFTHEDIQADIDWQDKLNELFQLAREGQLEDRYKKVEEIREKGVREETVLTMDIAKIQRGIEEIAESLTIEPVDADIDFHPNEKEKFVLSPEKAGQRVDAQMLYQSAEQIFASGQPGVIPIEPIVVEPEVRMADLEKATSKIVTFSTSISARSVALTSSECLSSKNFSIV
jgi:vancomycin resistance protein YoaR